VYINLRNGNLKKPEKCSNFNINFECKGRLEAHHEDYSKPLDIVWLCKNHHTVADIKRRWISKIEKNYVINIKSKHFPNFKYEPKKTKRIISYKYKKCLNCGREYCKDLVCNKSRKHCSDRCLIDRYSKLGLIQAI
jgi:hypothetical protein